MKKSLGFGWVVALLVLGSWGCAATQASHPAVSQPVATTAIAHPSKPTTAAIPTDPVSQPAATANAKTLPASASDILPKLPSPALAPVVAVPISRCQLPEEGEDAAGFYNTDAWPRGEVVLTFDDGPHPTATPRVLDLLAKYDMQATFFVVGRAINRRTYHLLQRMVSEGHTVGAHSYNHDIDMATRVQGERTIAYVQGQHAVTQILIDLSLLATSPDHFDQLYRRVFEEDPLVYLPSSSLRSDLPAYVARHEALLSTYGFGPSERVYPVLYSRPPGGAPYLGQSAAWSKDAYNEALKRLGMANVMWHGGAGDTVPQKRADFDFLFNNMRHHARRGGVMLVHDYIRADALAAALKFMAGDPAIRVVSIHEAMERKTGCTPWALRERLHPEATAPAAMHAKR